MAVDVKALYERYGPMVLRRCRAILKGEDEAMDALQDVFIQVIRNQNTLEDKGLSSLLYTMATNTCLNLIRSRRTREDLVVRSKNPEDDLLSQIAIMDDHEEKTNASFTTDQFFSLEKPSTRAMAVYYFVDGMTLEETATAVNLSVSGVRKRLAGLKIRGKIFRESLQ